MSDVSNSLYLLGQDLLEQLRRYNEIQEKKLDFEMTRDLRMVEQFEHKKAMDLAPKPKKVKFSEEDSY